MAGAIVAVIDLDSALVVLCNRRGNSAEVLVRALMGAL